MKIIGKATFHLCYSFVGKGDAGGNEGDHLTDLELAICRQK